MTTDTKLNQLIINKLTQEQYDEAKAAGTLSDTELYITDSDDEALTNNNISNCITEIPQDIKLELNNGRLTLKAGSKVYVPNGFEADGTTLKFDKVVIESDIRVDSPTADGPNFIYYVSNGKYVIGLDDKHQCSGTSNTLDYGLWYNTTNNFIRFAGGEVSEDNTSLPLAIINGTSDGSWTSIDQVFNGFGYIGSTVFALPGVKGLIPNGRNADGSLKSIEFTTSSVKIITYDSQTFNEFDLCFNGNSFDWYTNFNVKEDNYCYNGNSKITQTVNIGRFRINQSSDNGKIAWFTPKTVFHALDYNDKSTISGWSMPSSRYIDLTSAHGQNYIAPANGYFSLQGYMTGASFGNTLGLYNQTKKMGMSIQTPESIGSRRDTFVPVSKGDTVTVYCYLATVTQFRFIFAEGEN